MLHAYQDIQERKIIKNERRCRNGVPKSTQTRKDKSDGKLQKLYPQGGARHQFINREELAFILMLYACIISPKRVAP